MSLFKGSEDFKFLNLSGWIQKHKPALSKSDSSWDNSYSVRLLIVLLAVNVAKLQFLVCNDNFFCLYLAIFEVISCSELL